MTHPVNPNSSSPAAQTLEKIAREAAEDWFSERGRSLYALQKIIVAAIKAGVELKEGDAICRQSNDSMILASNAAPVVQSDSDAATTECFRCPRCNGNGSNGIDGECLVCDGTGFRPDDPTPRQARLMALEIPLKGDSVGRGLSQGAALLTPKDSSLGSQLQQKGE